MTLPAPYFQDDLVTLYHGDALQLLPLLSADCIITDPPYGETSLQWDQWQDGWAKVATDAASQMWCFGSMRMFMEHSDEFTRWRMSQDIVWEKHNGTGLFNDRFRRIHEHAIHFYQFDWQSIYKNPQVTMDATARTVRKKARPAHWIGATGDTVYKSEDGGPRLVTSVIFARSCHGDAVHPTQKPEAIISPLMEYSVPPGGLVIDCFAGSGAVLSVARKTGRRAIGIEAREEYCKVIVDRLSQRDLAI